MSSSDSEAEDINSLEDRRKDSPATTGTGRVAGRGSEESLQELDLRDDCQRKTGVSEMTGNSGLRTGEKIT